MLKDNLTKLGLTPNEAETYLYLVDNFKAKASEVAKYLEVTHPAAKKILDSLIGKRIVRAQEYGKTTYYFPHDTKTIIDYIESQSEKIKEEIIEKIELAKKTYKLIQGKSAINKDTDTEVQLYKGKDDILDLSKDIANSKDKTVYEFVDLDLVMYSNKKDQNDYSKDYKKNNIKFEVIYTSDAKTLDPIVEADVVRIPKNNTHFPTAQMMVFDDKVAFSFVTDDKNTIFIKNQWVVNTLRTLFDNLKENLKK